MTKSNDKKVPALRFKGFTDDWEQRKLGDLTKRVKSYPISHNDEMDSITGTKYIHYGDIHTRKFTRIENDGLLPNIIDHNYISLENGDVVVADASEDYKGIADACIVDRSKSNYKIIAGLHTIAFRPNNKLKANFLYNYFSTSIFKHYGYKMGTGLKVFGITYNNLANMIIKIPDIQEQTKINEILNTITKLLSLQQRKLKLVYQLKKTLLEQLISEKGEPIVRFNSFRKEWERFRLENFITKTIKGKAKAEMVGNRSIYLDTSYLNGGTPSTVDAPTDVYIDDTIILWDGSLAGKVYHGFSGALGSTLKSFTPKYSGEYLFQYLQKSQEKIFKNYRTPNIPHVIKDFTTVFRINAPSLEEQNKISAIFELIDRFTSNQSITINKLKKIKRSLLQKLFI